MAGIATPSTTLIVSNEPLSRLISKVSQLLETAVLSGFSDDESSSETVILRTQASPPTLVDNDLWHDTTTKSLRHCFGASGDLKWEPFSDGITLMNSTSAQRVLGDVVGFSSIANPFEFDDNSAPTGGICGVVQETIELGARGYIKTSGLSTVRVTGPLVRGDLIGLGTIDFTAHLSNFLFGSIGLALTNPSGGTVTALLWPPR